MEKYEVIKFKDNEFEMDVNVSPNEETVWLTQEQIVLLFLTTKQNVSFHINNIIDSNELDVNSTVKEILTVSGSSKKEGLDDALKKGFQTTKCWEFNLDSLDLVELVLKLEEKFDIYIINELNEKSTLEDISDSIANAKCITKYKQMPQPVATKSFPNKVKDFFSKTRQ